MTRKLRVLHAPESIGGNAAGLARAERSLGVDSRVFSLRPSRFGYRSDVTVARSALGGEFARLGMLRVALNWADVVHFNFGRSISPWRKGLTDRDTYSTGLRRVYNGYAGMLEGRDLSLLRRRGKGIVVTFQGDDVRLPSLMVDRPGVVAAYPGDHSADDAIRQAQIALWNQNADALFALNPDLLRHLPSRARFLPYASVSPTEVQPLPPRADGPLRIVHAPTDRRLKGTEAIVSAVHNLQVSGLDLELELIEDLPHDEAFKRYGEADVGLDQLNIGWYGAFAVEVMALGRPVLSFVDERDRAYVPSQMWDEIPIVNSNSETVERALSDLCATSRIDLAAMGERSREYVMKWHDPTTVAEETVRLYEQIVASKT